jgi:hypothetical protein
MNSTTTLPAPTANAAKAATAPRFDMYASIHKALRSFMSQTLLRIGQLDVFDADDMAHTLDQLEALLTLCEKHIQHENEFVHAAIDARRPHGAQRTEDDHIEHQLSIRALRQEAAALQVAAPAERQPLALRLYRHLALFLAENFQHMQIEETANNAALWALYSDAELHLLHDQLLDSIPPEEHLEIARWMVPALSPIERAGMLGAIRATNPPEAFLGLIEAIRPHLEPQAWVKLARDLGLTLPAPKYA